MAAKDEPTPVETPVEGEAPVIDLPELIERTVRDAVELATKPREYGLHEKMSRILGEIDDVEARGHAKVKGTAKSGVPFEYDYDYILESDLMAAVRPKLAAAGIAVYYSDEILSHTGGVTTVRIRLKLVDAETGEAETLSGDGQGADAGDKGANKAKTAAVRYVLWKTFLVPSDVDPEQDSTTAASAAAAAQARETAAASKKTAPAKGAADPARVRKQLVGLANEIDVAQGKRPGTTAEALTAAVYEQTAGTTIDDLGVDDLVVIGTALTAYLNDPGGVDFVLPKLSASA